MDKRLFKDFDYIIFISMCSIFALGLFSLYSASFHKTATLGRNLLLAQLIWMGIGFVFFIVVLSQNYLKLISDLAYPFYFLSLFILLVVLIIGEVRLGAQRWIEVLGVSFQPSEFAKLAYVFCLANYLGNRKTRSYALKDLIVPAVMTLVPMAFILKQPDLGTALIFVPVSLAMFYIWGLKLKHLLWVFATGLAASPLFWIFMKGYQKKRLLVFLNPNLDPLGAGYTVIQSKIAVGSGGFFGKGWLGGTQNQLRFLPESHTDFIFSVLGEEWGFVGAFVLVMLFAVIIVRGYLIAHRTNNLFGKLSVVGLTTMLAFQVIVNLLMTMGFMPVVGIPLPLVSYGGSSLIVTMISLAVILNVGMRRPVF